MVMHESNEDFAMLWKKGRRSDNVVDARGDGGGSGGGGMRMGGKGDRKSVV